MTRSFPIACDRRRVKVHLKRHGKRLTTIFVRKLIPSMDWFKNWGIAGLAMFREWEMLFAAEAVFPLRPQFLAVMFTVRISVPLAPFSRGRRSILSVEGRRLPKKFEISRKEFTRPSRNRSMSGVSSRTTKAGSMKQRENGLAKGGTLIIIYTVLRR